MTIDASERDIELYRANAPAPNTPLVFLLSGSEDGSTVWELASSWSGRAFSLVVIPVTDWENELSPWAVKSVFRGGRNFGCGADETVQRLERVIVPEVRRALGCPDAPCFVAGYSLAGLFAIYALYRTPIFSGAVSASGSLWFPGFLDYAAANEMPRQPERVYLSLGDREKNTRNAVMRCVEDNTADLHERLQARGIDCTFELNPGNHFQDAEERLAKGITWIIRR